jgi:hypothetical protein
VIPAVGSGIGGSVRGPVSHFGEQVHLDARGGIVDDGEKGMRAHRRGKHIADNTDSSLPQLFVFLRWPRTAAT